MPPNPRHDHRAPCPWARSAERRSRVHLMAHAGHAATASRRERASTRFRSSIIRRADVEFLGRKPETGGTPTPPWSSSCVTRDPTASDSAIRPPKRPEWPREQLSGLDRVLGEHDLDGCHPVGQGATHGRILKPGPITAKPPAGNPSRDHVGRVVGHDVAALGRGPRDRVRGCKHLAARRSRGRPETQGSEGAQPPASLRRGLTECGHTEYAG